MTHMTWFSLWVIKVFQYEPYSIFRMYSDDSLDEYDADNVEYLNEFDDLS